MIRFSAHAFLTVLLASTMALSCSKSEPPTKPQPPQLGDVEILSIPTGATILLDGSSTAKTTPDTLQDVAAGSRVIGLRFANYADTAVTINVVSGALARVEVSLRHFSTYVPPAIELEPHPMTVAGIIRAISTADFNLDGSLDLVVTSSELPHRRVLLLTGTGDGSFSANSTVVDTTANLWGMTAGDFNHDGYPDVACLVEASRIADILLFLGNGNGTFRRGGIVHFPYSPQSAQVSPLRAADLNGDGADDLVVGYRFGTTTIGLGVWLADGSGGLQAMVEYTKGFNPQVVATSNGIAFADFTGDGVVDVAQGLYNIEGQPGGVILWRGTGGGSLLSSATYIQTTGYCLDLATDDFNRDGRADLVSANTGASQAQGTADVLLGRGDGTFQAPVSYSTGMFSSAVVVGDFNADLRSDLAVINNYSSFVSVLAGYGDGVFMPAVSFPTSTGGASVAIGDFDGNSRPDLAITNDSSASPSTLDVQLSR